MEKGIVSGKGIEITRQDKGVAISQGGVQIRHEGKPVKSSETKAGFVYVLLDCSTSMVGDKIEQAKKGALSYAKDALSKGYLIGLITFSSEADHVCEPQKQLSVLKRNLEGIVALGTTNMTEAIHLATMKLRSKIGHRAIVIATDGMPDEKSTALEAAQKAKENGIQIDAIGTDDADQYFLKKLASRPELGIKVPREQFEKGIASAAKSLPLLLGDGRPKPEQKGR